MFGIAVQEVREEVTIQISINNYQSPSARDMLHTAR
jgi:hypothetical protein